MIDIVLFLFILAIIGIVYWYWTIPKNLPPGPIGLPLIGSSLDYWDGTKQHIVLKEHVKKYGPIFKFYIAEKLVIILGDYESIQEALVKRAEVFIGRPQMKGGLPEEYTGYGIIFSQGDLWKEQRRFALSTLRDFGLGRPILEEKIKEELEYIGDRIKRYAHSKMAFDPTCLLIAAVSNIISQLVFGRRFDYDDQFVHHFTALTKRVSGSGVGMISPFVLSDQIYALLKLLPAYDKYIKETHTFIQFSESQARKTMETYDPDSEPTNYIHAFMKASQSSNTGSFSDIQLVASVFDIFTAGTETTSTTVRWLILIFATHPHVQEKVYEEIREKVGVNVLPKHADKTKLPYTEAVILETQRFANLVPLGLMRQAVTPTKLMGYDIPEQAILIPLLDNILHNPQLYPQPDTFRPERFLDQNGKVIRDPKLIPFQAGKRICLGEGLARMELFFFVVGLASRFKFTVPADEPAPSLSPLVGMTSSPMPYKVTVEVRED